MGPVGPRLPSLFEVTLFLCAIQLIDSHGDSVRKLLFISLDGFRHDHIEHYGLKNFEDMGSKGVRAEHISSSYITKTFPNHATLITGLYEESHGIVSNHMLSPGNHTVRWTGCSTYGVDYPACGTWYRGEPLWSTNARSFHNKRASAAIYYPGSNVHWGPGQKHPPPDIHVDFPPSNVDPRPFRETIDATLNWFTKFESLNLVTLYHHEPDHTSHRHGPRSAETERVLRSLDADLGYLWKKMEELELEHEVNVVVTSDHGFANITTKPVTVQACLNGELSGTKGSQEAETLFNKLDMLDNSPLADIWVKDEYAENKKEIIKAMYDKMQGTPGCRNIKFFTQHQVDGVLQIPEEYHYRRSSRVPDVLLEAPVGTSIHPTAVNWTELGDHGWNSSVPEMSAIFLAKGSAFKKGHRAGPFENVHMYELMCAVLGAHPAPNNGSLDTVRGLLSPHVARGEEGAGAVALTTSITVLLTALLCASLAGLFIIMMCQQHRKRIRSFDNLTPSRTVAPNKTNGGALGRVPHRNTEGSSLLPNGDDDGSSVDEF